MKKGWQNAKLLERIPFKKVILFNLFIAISTIFFGIIGLIPVLLLRFRASKKHYWLSLVILLAGFAILSPIVLIILIAILLAIETFFLLEGFKFSLFFNLLMSSLVATGFLCASFFTLQDSTLFVQLLTQLEPLKQKFLSELSPKTFTQLLAQVPSLLVVSFSFLFFFSLRWISFCKSNNTLADIKQFQLSGFSTNSYLVQLKKRSFNFSVSSWGVWVFILALLLSFVDLSLPPAFKTFGINVLNICFAFYFLQGLGIITDVLSLLKLKKTTKRLIYLISFIYLFSFISVLGFLDYWFSFRTKIKLYKILNKKK
ncbi:MAG: hypothetical protein HAW63_03580 [Bdellovibrionaceae bacterium]|nr:hypothetical protein [Pseudobdellovibrionaceae bacterium]